MAVKGSTRYLDQLASRLLPLQIQDQNFNTISKTLDFGRALAKYQPINIDLCWHLKHFNLEQQFPRDKTTSLEFQKGCLSLYSYFLETGFANSMESKKTFTNLEFCQEIKHFSSSNSTQIHAL